MSGIEVIGLVIGLIGFAGQMGHYTRKMKARRRQRLLGSGTTPTRPRHSSLPIPAQKDNYNNRQLISLRSAAQTMGQMHLSSNDLLKYSTAAWQQTVTQQSLSQTQITQMFERKHAAHMADIRYLGQVTWVMMIIIAILMFALGFLLADNNHLQAYKAIYNFRLNEHLPILTADYLTISTPIATKNLIRTLSELFHSMLSGYLYLPLTVLGFITLPFDLLYSCFSYIPVPEIVSTVVKLVTVAIITFCSYISMRQASKARQRQCKHRSSLTNEFSVGFVLTFFYVFLTRSAAGLGWHYLVSRMIFSGFMLGLVVEGYYCDGPKYIVCPDS